MSPAAVAANDRPKRFHPTVVGLWDDRAISMAASRISTASGRRPRAVRIVPVQKARGVAGHRRSFQARRAPFPSSASSPAREPATAFGTGTSASDSPGPAGLLGLQPDRTRCELLQVERVAAALGVQHRPRWRDPRPVRATPRPRPRSGPRSGPDLVDLQRLEIVNPGGTGSPSFTISARFAACRASGKGRRRCRVPRGSVSSSIRT